MKCNGDCGVCRNTVLHNVVMASIIVCMSSAAALADVEFRASMASDTIYEYESIILNIELHNNAAARFYHRPLILCEDFVDPIITDAVSGDTLPICVHHASYMPDRDIEKHESIEGGGTRFRPLDLLHTSTCWHDSTAGVPYWPPGSYRAHLHWLYDPFRRTTVGNSRYLTDSVDFVVVAASGGLLGDLEEFRLARRAFYSEGEKASANALWHLVQRTPSSPYARVALWHLLFTYDIGRTLPDGVSGLQLITAFIQAAPHMPQCQYLVPRLVEDLDPVRRAEVLDSLWRANPGSVAGRTARSLMEDD